MGVQISLISPAFANKVMLKNIIVIKIFILFTHNSEL